MQIAISQSDQCDDDLTIKIPQTLAHQAGLCVGMQVELQIQDNKLIIMPVGKQFSLAELLAEITPDNIHQAIDTGPSVGKEVW